MRFLLSRFLYPEVLHENCTLQKGKSFTIIECIETLILQEEYRMIILYTVNIYCVTFWGIYSVIYFIILFDILVELVSAFLPISNSLAGVETL